VSAEESRRLSAATAILSKESPSREAARSAVREALVKSGFTDGWSERSA
jgi:hypothetical protein